MLTSVAATVAGTVLNILLSEVGGLSSSKKRGRSTRFKSRRMLNDPTKRLPFHSQMGRSQWRSNIEAIQKLYNNK